MIDQITRTRAEELRQLVRESSERNAAGRFVAEGAHLIERALESAPEKIKEVIGTEKALSENSTLIKHAERKNIQLFQISQKLAEKISDTKTTQGIFAVISMADDVDKLPDAGVAVFLDEIQDPGNVGTIIRTCSWFGVKHIYLSKGCADPYSAKVLRATQGEIFSTKVGKRGEIEKYLRILHNKDWQILAATVGPAAGSLYKTAFRANVAVIFGSEAHGVSSALTDIADGQIMIPNYGSGESLNVATSAGIILSEIRRKNG